MQVVPPPQAFDASLGVYYPLLSGVKRMALAAKLHSHGGFGRTGVVNVATGTSDHGVIEFGMDVCFHDDWCLAWINFPDRNEAPPELEAAMPKP